MMKFFTPAITILLLSSAGVVAQDGTASAPRLITKRYQLTRTFLANFDTGLKGRQVADPFAEPREDAENVPPVAKSVQKTLADTGIAFIGEEAGATLDRDRMILSMTNTADQFQLLEINLDLIASRSPKGIHVIYEAIEVDHGIFSDWLFDNKLDDDGTKLRKEVQRWIGEGNGAVIESALVQAKSGQRAKIESIDEFIYPTEYDPGEIPGEVTLSGGAEAPVMGINPTAFETRNLGTTLEVDPVLGADDVTYDLNLSPEMVELEGIETWHKKTVDPRFQVTMPTFYTQKITTQVTGTDGRYVFLGTTRPLKAEDAKRKNPIVLHFTRADIAKPGGWKEIPAENP